MHVLHMVSDILHKHDRGVDPGDDRALTVTSSPCPRRTRRGEDSRGITGTEWLG